jgi:hypothetical protein
MDMMADILGNAVFIAAPGLLVIAVVMRVLRRPPALLQDSIHSLLLAIALAPTIAIDTPHGPIGFPAVLALIGNGPGGFEDSIPLGVIPIATAWVLFFAVLWLRSQICNTCERHFHIL